MSRDKQIEEMAKAVCHLDRTCDECMVSFECKAMVYAKRFYEAGYRKASEVAREIFEEISKASVNWGCYCLTLSKSAFLTEDVNRTLAELKKKYTEGE